MLPTELVSLSKSESQEETSEVTVNGMKYIYYYRIMFNFLYYSGLCPFKLKRNTPFVGEHCVSEYVLHTNRFQKGVCRAVYFSIFFLSVSLIRLMPDWSEFGKSMWISTFMMSSVISGIVLLTYLATLWNHQEKYIDMFKILQQYDMGKSKRSTIISVILPVLVVFVGNMVTMAWEIYAHDLFTYQYQPVEKENLNWKKFYSRMLKQAKNIYLFYPGADNQDPSFVPWEIVLTIFHTVIIIPYFIFYYTLVPLVYISIVTHWHVVRDFLDFCKRKSQGDSISEGEINKILIYYERLRHQADIINSSVGPMLILLVSCSLPFFAMFAGSQVLDPDLRTTMGPIMAFSFIQYFLTLAQGGNIDYMASEFYSWIASEKHISIISLKRYSTLLMDMQSRQLSVKGKGLFVLTYQVFIGIFGVLVTYTVIYIQFQSVCKEEERIQSVAPSNCSCN